MNDLQDITRKTKDRPIRTPLKTLGEGVNAVPASQDVVLLLL
jgi:hypothetical protein